ncbi:SDR family NAD(P)-dependent oxidoreductase [Pseudalkalibacillus salsuginis]|uniref:SDR family NAD(P)-dependent oxidoreductase n=1 Tax=Pseudalkalibacillus salsuginis TaxID=2910972 RepID=UPI001F48BC71|nr:SDR family oxidoreductase [Pseudalkalibacillus salsuginis]MCF6408350.1 SDR family oxidoreductase [Pseudalkalibacillus salsuginis]
MSNVKIVVITGASSGIGAEMARMIASKGWTPVLMARSFDRLEHLRNEIKNDYKTTAHTFQLDVQDKIHVDSVFNQMYQEVGAIDVLINNAGFGVFDYFQDAKMEDIEGMFNTNVLGMMACTKAVLPGMIEQKRGQIINIASQAAKIATVKGSVYAATKHAVLGFSNSLRMEVEDFGIQVTTVNPGPIKTNFLKIADQTGQYEKNIGKWMLRPSEVASKIVGAIEKPVREINLPGWMEAGSKMYQLMPTLMEKVGKKAFRQK